MGSGFSVRHKSRAQITDVIVSLILLILIGAAPHVSGLRIGDCSSGLPGPRRPRTAQDLACFSYRVIKPRCISFSPMQWRLGVSRFVFAHMSHLNQPAKAADSTDTEEVPGGDTGAGSWAGDDQGQ